MLQHYLRFELYLFFFNLCAKFSLALYYLSFWKKLRNLRLRFNDFIFSYAICACDSLVLLFLSQFLLAFYQLKFWLLNLCLRINIFYLRAPTSAITTKIIHFLICFRWNSLWKPSKLIYYCTSLLKCGSLAIILFKY